MMQHNLPTSQWVKSSYSGDNGGNCLEWQMPSPGTVAVGDSKDRTQGAFVFPATSWSSFVNAVKDGKLDR